MPNLGEDIHKRIEEFQLLECLGLAGVTQIGFLLVGFFSAPLPIA